VRIGAREHRSVILLGAGATRGAYQGIGPAKIRPPLNADFFKVARKFVASAHGSAYRGPFRRIHTFIEREMRLRRSEEPTMEQVFNVLFISKDMPKIFSQGGRPREAGFRREIKDFLRLVVGVLRYIQENPRHPLNVNHHAWLVQHLDPGDTLISLNYDTLMDNALIREGWDPRIGYGFNARHKVRHNPPAPTGGALVNLGDVLLIKPHGSLNWYAKGTITSYESVLLNRPPSRIIVSDVPRAYDIVAQRLVRFFIPPLYAKFFANRFWRALWDTAFRRLTEADSLVIIGCSLIESDFHLRAIVGRALAKRREQFSQVIRVDRSEEVQRRLKQFLRGRSKSGFVTFPTFTDFVAAHSA